jgi:hypothetical protein
MYYIHAVLLDGCSYSISAQNLLNTYNIRNTTTIINYNNKNKFKSTNINTFPQIYLKKQNNKGSLLLGGYDNLDEIFKTFYKKKINDTNIKLIQNKYNISRKTILRLIELLNNL